MFKEFKTIPLPLQKRILSQAGLALVSLMLFLFLLITLKNFNAALPGLFMFLFFTVGSFMLFAKSVEKKYVVISGQCCGVNLTAVKKHTKSILLNADGRVIKITMKQRNRKIQQGTLLDIYADESAPLCETPNGFLLQSYLVIDVREN